jgi:hypothetical protein
MKRLAAALVGGLCALVLVGPASQAAERTVSTPGGGPPVIPKPPCTGSPALTHGTATLSQPGRGAATTASNKRLAIADAKRLIALVKPPSGAVLRSHGAELGISRHVAASVGVNDSAIDWRTWVVPGQLCSVFTLVIHSMPRGLAVMSTGYGGPSPNQSVWYERPAIDGQLGSRTLLVAVSRRSADSTLLSLTSQSQWIVTRSPKDRVPASARVVDVTTVNAHGRTSSFRVVTTPAKVHALIKLVNSLGVPQPGEINCPADIGAGATVTVTFRASPGAAALASVQAPQNADFNWPDTTPGWACTAASFTLLGKTQPELWGNFDGPLERILHIKLAR